MLHISTLNLGFGRGFSVITTHHLYLPFVLIPMKHGIVIRIFD